MERSSSSEPSSGGEEMRRRARAKRLQTLTTHDALLAWLTEKDYTCNHCGDEVVKVVLDAVNDARGVRGAGTHTWDPSGCSIRVENTHGVGCCPLSSRPRGLPVCGEGAEEGLRLPPPRPPWGGESVPSQGRRAGGLIGGGTASHVPHPRVPCRCGTG